jgi:2-dehydro-3-deoxyphosphogluconate aldolase/(4S)-4-hydroxy-2-oxoglutarate aldolase
MGTVDCQAIVAHIIACRLIAIVRLADADLLLPTAEALRAGGVEVIEFTLTTPGALEQLRVARQHFGDTVILGAGTVLDAEAARQAAEAGAQFIVAPNVDPAVIRLCHRRRYNLPVIPGALTPTEIVAAWTAGADLIKVFPASVGGPGYIREVLAPLPHVRLVPTGGVTTENVTEFLNAGAVAVGVGSGLVDKAAVAAKDWPTLTERGRHFVALAAERGQA